MIRFVYDFHAVDWIFDFFNFLEIKTKVRNVNKQKIENEYQ